MNCYRPGRCGKFALFSPQMNSMGSQPGRKCISYRLPNGFVYAPGSSMIMSITIVP